MFVAQGLLGGQQQHGKILPEATDLLDKADSVQTAEAARQIEGMLKGRTRILVGRDAKVQDLQARFLPKAHTPLFHRFLKGLLK